LKLIHTNFGIAPKRLFKVLNAHFLSRSLSPLDEFCGASHLSRVQLYKIALLYNINPNSALIAKAIKQGHWDNEILSKVTGAIFRGLLNKI